MADAAALNTLHDIYLSEMQELRSAEDLMSNALPELAGRATNGELSRMLNDDVAEHYRAWLTQVKATGSPVPAVRFRFAFTSSHRHLPTAMP